MRRRTRAGAAVGAIALLGLVPLVLATGHADDSANARSAAVVEPSTGPAPMLPPLSSVLPAPLPSPTPDPTPTTEPDPLPPTGPDGFVVVPGTGPVAGAHGATLTWTLEIEPATGLDTDQVLAVVAATLEDARHGWTAALHVRLQRIDEVRAADLRVVLATPDSVDRLCAEHGLDTAGLYSCWDGQRAMLNVHRWQHGAADFDDLGTYRTYLVNHEVGHGLGFGHTDCPGAGRPAPVMMQQSITVGACQPNGWPAR